jgi:hypothetical protein
MNGITKKLVRCTYRIEWLEVGSKEGKETFDYKSF